MVVLCTACMVYMYVYNYKPCLGTVKAFEERARKARGPCLKTASVMESMCDRPTNPRVLPPKQGSTDTTLAQGATLAEKLRCSKEDLVQTTNFINTNKLHV